MHTVMQRTYPKWRECMVVPTLSGDKPQQGIYGPYSFFLLAEAAEDEVWVMRRTHWELKNAL